MMVFIVCLVVDVFLVFVQLLQIGVIRTPLKLAVGPANDLVLPGRMDSMTLH